MCKFCGQDVKMQMMSENVDNEYNAHECKNCGQDVKMQITHKMRMSVKVVIKA